MVPEIVLFPNSLASFLIRPVFLPYSFSSKQTYGRIDLLARTPRIRFEKQFLLFCLVFIFSCDVVVGLFYWVVQWRRRLPIVSVKNKFTFDVRGLQAYRTGGGVFYFSIYNE